MRPLMEGALIAMGLFDRTADQATGRRVTATPATGEPPERPDNRKPMTPAAERALAEAAERRAEVDRRAAERPKEFHGRSSGLDPARYGDWEVKGICSDF